jgi:hypothetical protein
MCALRHPFTNVTRLLLLLSCMALLQPARAQNTQIRGFVDAFTSYQKGKVSFGFGEQDLFITSSLNDRISFLGESVFKFDPNSHTTFSVSIERIVLKYNIKGNHNILIGKHHTPLNYWNDTYHHGRLFFPTIERPLLFAADIIPLHTAGISLQGQNLGAARFGYDLMLGNGLGSSDILDNDKHKSITAAMHIKPVNNLRLGASYYHDVISKGATVHDRPINWNVRQNLLTGSAAYFGKKWEALAESTFGINHTDTTGSKHTVATYLYTGYRATEKLVPYLRLDNLHYESGELYFHKDNITSLVVGGRYEINYLAVLKLEYQYRKSEIEGTSNGITAQFAIGF